MADSTAYDPFGTPHSHDRCETPNRLPGDYTDPDTGQVNMTAPWYNPGTGTFTSRDGFLLPGDRAEAFDSQRLGEITAR